MRKYIVLGLVGLSLLIFAACGTAAPPASGPTATPSTQTGPTPSSSSPSEETQLVTRGQSFRFQYACINRTLAPCGLMQDFAESVRERTEGQVDIQISSFPELGLTGADTLRLIRDGTLNMVELYPGYVGGDWPFIEMGELLGLFPDAETQLEVALSLREDEARLLRERFNAQPIAYHFYDSQFFFSKQPLNSQADFSGKKIRQQ